MLPSNDNSVQPGTYCSMPFYTATDDKIPVRTPCDNYRRKIEYIFKRWCFQYCEQTQKRSLKAIHCYTFVYIYTAAKLIKSHINACILKAYSLSHSTSRASLCVSATQPSLSVHYYESSISGKLHLHSDHSQTVLTLEVVVEFEWSLSVEHTFHEPHSHKLVIIKMANLQRNNRKENWNYNFNCEMYDKEKFRSRFRLTKDVFREMFDIIQADISAYNEPRNLYFLHK